MKKIFLLLALLALPVPALAQRVNQMIEPLSSASAGSGIAAVVNESVVTTTDVEQRIRLAMMSSGLPDTAEVRSHLLPQILRGLIDEQLQAQEAKRLDLTVSASEVDQALDHIAHDNNIQGSMTDYVSSHGVSPDALTSQIRTGLLWNKIVQRELRPRVDIGDDEIDSVIERVRADAGKREFLVSEIFLAVDNPKDEDQVKQVADNLVHQIRSGANFPAVAREFSQGTGAANGGDIGWIQQGQLAPEINRALENGEKGKISDPIRTANGFHILGIRDTRTVSLGDPEKASLNLIQTFHPYTEATKDSVLQETGRLRAAVRDCAALENALTGFPGWTIQKMGDISLTKAPPALLEKVRNVSIGNSSEPLATDKGAALLFVCGRNEGGDVDREAILRSIGSQKLELQARRLLRDLRRDAYIDIRIGGAN